MIFVYQKCKFVSFPHLVNYLVASELYPATLWCPHS